MSTLRVILDDMLVTASRSMSRYAEDLSRELIATAPRGVIVEGFVSASTELEYADIAARLPGLATLHKSSLARRELLAAWQHGFTRLPGSGMVHAPSLLAPLARHDRLNDGNQIAVTIHDTVAWSHPEALSSRRVNWHRSMLKRAERYADAIVVPSHAVADEVEQLSSVGDRVRVISGAPSTAFTTIVSTNTNTNTNTDTDEDDRESSLELPDRYVLAIIEPGTRGASTALVQSLLGIDDAVPLLIVGIEPGDTELTSVLAEPGIGENRVRALGALPDPELRVVLERAAVLLAVTVEEGWGMPVLDAFALGTPVVHLGTPALLELSDGAATVVEAEPAETFGSRVGEAVTSILDDATLAERLRYSGFDRARAFTWRSAAEKVWQLHADL